MTPKQRKEDQVWTEDENQDRQMDNMINRTGKSCKNCHWGGYEKGNEFVTCGYHIENFTVNSFCSYWTDPADPKLKAYHDRIRERLKKKFKEKLTKEK